ncbi:YihY/virulence factor BrkB family protein [Actinoplanes aureus]|uniref:YihY/virulence factor BrkB family protein n=1 Tax=Actinoplanes aureus TaxID=2792083 RepID=A0A931CHA7_9ACTN|nr:YhjD/YihY/BrkB family envelope integrity protein [Actinoplanes aureus]MBG0567171.1 YihY/virulence factor BrkB family protein [Actinoplanes aureus]
MIVRRLDDLQRRWPVLGFCYAVICKYLDDGGIREAALITYYGFLSLFPTLLLGVTIVSEVLVRHPELRQEVVAAIVPPLLQDGVENSVAAFTSSSTALVLGVIGLVFSGIGVVVSAYETLNHLAAVPFVRRPGVVVRYLRVVAGLAIILAGTVTVGALTVAASSLSMWPGPPRFGAFIGSCGVVFVVLVSVARLLLARPATLGMLWPAALPGAVAVTLVLHLGATVLPEIVRRAGRVYGAFATVAGIFTLLYLLSNALVIAAEIAAVRHARLWPRALDPGRPAPADARAMLLLAREQERLPAASIDYVLRDPPAGADCVSEAGVKPPRGR